MNIDNAPLLPSGFVDYLPEDATRLHDMTSRLLAHYHGYGYELVIPPLVEYESSLRQNHNHNDTISLDDSELSRQSFRLMDPISQNMMAIRTDMTWQVGRIIDSRLSQAPRPLRLCYMGDVLRVKGQAMQPLRQLKQIGCEHAGDQSPYADAEIISLALTSADLLGLKECGLDLTLPPLLPLILRHMLKSEQRQDAQFMADLMASLNDKEIKATKALLVAQDAALIDLISELIAISGDLHEGMARLKHLYQKGALLPKGEAQKLVLESIEGYHALQNLGLLSPKSGFNIMMTIDLIDHRGFDYHTGLAFHLFAGGLRSELAHGGRYLTPHKGEGATGFSVYCEELLRIMPFLGPDQRLAIPHDTGQDKIQELRNKGFVTLRLPANYPFKEALKRMKKTHHLTHYLDEANEIIPL